ncbi:MAG: chloride channel protein [Aestuariivita sp.]|nr:chloride channel protein [Aestuariivita sp.]MCY4202420.1 chloride channel protein [Aestuariivita sp.]MCY4345588.1 chloride channel protein [Aestuariivita sp.]
MGRVRAIWRLSFRQTVAHSKQVWHLLRDRGPSQIQFWFIAMAIGIVAGLAALFFRKGIEALQAALYGTDDVQYIHTFAESLPWFWVLILPIIGGLVVGLILHVFTPDGRVRSVADVIEGAALRDGRVETRAGIASACASLITLSSGGSSGREGPVVHLAGVIATRVSEALKADGITGRDLLGCAVAAAVSASFNAPIAGTIFALEVVLRHFAFHAFAPISIAAVAGTVINRLEYGNVTEFTLTLPGVLQFYIELPAFLLLGILSGLVAVALMKSIFLAEDTADVIQRRIKLPRWLRPAIAGGLLGIIAIYFPHIIGVGYETTSLALTGKLLLHEAIVFCVIKVIAVTITIAGRMGGGVFSPSLMIGALSGLVFGLVATAIFPDISGSHTLYALAGMGAVSAAVLGAPISTTLIVFELTGDWQTGLAVLTAVSLSTAVASRLVDRSFFLTQLERRGIHLAAGPQAYLPDTCSVRSIMRPLRDSPSKDDKVLRTLINEQSFVDENTTLAQALPLFDRAGVSYIPVVTDQRAEEIEIIGLVHHVDALKAYNQALAATAAEEHS